MYFGWTGGVVCDFKLNQFHVTPDFEGLKVTLNQLICAVSQSKIAALIA